MDRRSFLRTTAALLPVAIAGCGAERGEDGGDTTTEEDTPPTMSQSPAGPTTATVRVESPSEADAPVETATSTPTPTETPTNTPTETVTSAPTETVTSTPTDRGIRVGMHAADATFTTLDDTRSSLSDYRGEKVMLWFVTTWCSASKQSAATLLRHHHQVQSVRILAIKIHGNAGYSGPEVGQFAERYAPETLPADHWVWGAADPETSQRYNPQDVIDMYYLIDEDGIIRTAERAPTTTVHKIVRFANR